MSTFVDELEGDVALSTILAGYYQKFVAVEKIRLQQNADLEEGIATSRLHDVICVPHKRPVFEEFRDLVDSSIKTAIYSLYGQFSEFMKPIITQDMLRTMENPFQRLLPIQHSPHMMLTNKAMRFAQTEYNCLNSNGDKDEKWMSLSDDLDPSNNRSNTAINCRAKEHLAIANYLHILGIGIEKPGRKYSKKEFIDALSKVEIRLEDKDEEARARRRMEEARSKDKGIMASIIDELFSNAERSPNDGNSPNRNVDLSVELDAANIARDGEDIKEEDDDDEVEDEDNEARGNVSSSKIIVASTQWPIGVWLANVNELCYVDIELEGHKILKRRNPEVARFNCHKQRRRKLTFFSEVHARLERIDDGEDLFQTAFNRFINH